jgi:histidinol dehydrogenase
MTMKTLVWNNLSTAQQNKLLQRGTTNDSMAIATQVQSILEAVIAQGDQALYDLTEKFDKVALSSLNVSDEEFKQAESSVSNDVKAALEFAAENVRRYHEAQVLETISVETRPGVQLERVLRPIEKVGLYVPAGTAPLVSTVLMLAIPAKIAGAAQVILCTPPNSKGEINPALLVAAKLCGISSVYKVGGAQAIAAMAYGTDSIPKVDKIFGPGNTYVTQAKMKVAQDPRGASIDMPAGPSEILIIADDSANPEFIAADLLSQAEHGIDSQAFLMTDSSTLIDEVQKALTNQLKALPRQEYLQESLRCGALIFVPTIDVAVDISNRYAPEHLSLQIKNPRELLTKITSAGAVFCGSYAPVSAGDYATGSNHVLPTGGYARNTNGLSLNDFMKVMHIQTLSVQGLEQIGAAAQLLAQVEGLDAHKKAIQIRCQSPEDYNDE